jgi:recombination protein RecT
MNALTLQIVQEKLEGMRNDFALTLPPGLSKDRFVRVALTAVQNNPALLECTPESLFQACRKAAEDGLLPDGREGAMALRKAKQRDGSYRRVAVWLPMVQGLIAKAKRRGSVANLVAHIVYEGEDCSISLGDEDRIVHRRDITKVKRGKEVMVYAIATMKDGTKERDHMTWEQVQHVRRSSTSPNDGPWVTHTDEMARKTVIRRLSKRLPSLDEGDDELQRAVTRVDELYPAVGNESAKWAELAVDPEGSAKSELAVEIESAGNTVRAVNLEGAEKLVRAVGNESAGGAERAVAKESAERLVRAADREGAVVAERAIDQESAESREQAENAESSVPKERAIRKESAKTLERRPKFSEWLEEYRGRAAACRTRAAVEYLAMDETATAVLDRGTENQILQLQAVLNAARVRVDGSADAVEPLTVNTTDAGDELYE